MNAKSLLKVFFLSLVIMVTSCNKEEPVSLEDVYLTDDVELMNGALNFVSPDAFFNYK